VGDAEEFMSKPFRSRPVVALLGVCIGAAAIASCDATALTGQPGGGTGGGATLVVYGTTTSAASGGVSAAITLVAEDAACSGTTYGSTTGSSSVDGTYRIAVSATSALAGCVLVTGIVAGNPNPVSIATSNVSFAGGDSVQVDLAFP
jgi:hypothetical protein